MVALPEAVAFTGSAITEAQQKTWIMNLRAYLAGLLGTTGDSADALDALGAVQADEDGRIPASLMPTSRYIDGASFLGIDGFELLDVSAADTYSLIVAFGDLASYSSTTSTSYVTAHELVVPNISGSIRFSCAHYVGGGATGSLQLYKNGALVNTWTTTSSLSTRRYADVTVSPGDVIVWKHKTSSASGVATAEICLATADKGLEVAKAYKILGV